MLCAHCNIGLHLYLCFNMLYACLLTFFCMTVNVVAKQLIKLLYTLCYTATESCHKLWPCSHFSDATYEFVFTCLGLCVYRACVSVCACVWKCIYDTWIRDTASVSELSTSVFSEMVDTSRVIALLFYQIRTNNIQYMYRLVVKAK